jgi:hypothetical protein
MFDRIRPEQQKLMKKGCSQIIQLSDFVEKKNRYLIIHNQDSIMIKDT